MRGHDGRRHVLQAFQAVKSRGRLRGNALHSGTSCFSRREVPMNVPLVPMLVTKCVTAPSVCRMISAPVPSKCARQLAGLPY